jgi:hypothetical protein
MREMIIAIEDKYSDLATDIAIHHSLNASLTCTDTIESIYRVISK